MVRTERLELSHLSAPEPKSGASTNSATFAFIRQAKHYSFFSVPRNVGTGLKAAWGQRSRMPGEPGAVVLVHRRFALGTALEAAVHPIVLIRCAAYAFFQELVGAQRVGMGVAAGKVFQR